MTPRGWIDYLQCFLFGHQYRMWFRHGSRQLHCARCSHPHNYTLRHRLKQLRNFWRNLWQQKPEKTSNEDEIPF